MVDTRAPVHVAGGDTAPFADTFVEEHRLALACLGLHFLVLGMVAAATHTWLLWLVVGVPAVLFPAWLVRHHPSAFLSRLAVAAGAMAFTLLGVEQTGGYMEAHFSFFVMITVIAVYRDWRLLIFASALVIVHHVGFTMFNPLAVGFYDKKDRFGAWRHVISHLSVGLMQVFALCYLTVLLRRREALNAALGSSLDRAKELAVRDPLTGLFNRNHLDDIVARLSPQARDGNMEAVLCLIDLDHFKIVNDKYGHFAGDEVLRAVARTIQHQLRSGDCAVRQGGEEFLVVLPHSSLADGHHFAERLRGHVGSQSILVAADAKITVTISIGLAAWRQGRTFDETFKLADGVLYEAKNRGRNRVEVWPDDNWKQPTRMLEGDRGTLVAA